MWTLLHAEDATKKCSLDYALYAGIAAALALPQVLTWSIPQTVGGSATTGSLSLRFNWVNYDTATGRLIDGYFWFWIKNVGPVYLLMVPAALLCKRRGRALSLGALFVYVTAELIQFQPNPYDNNKLFYVAFMLMLPLVGNYLVTVWRRLQRHSRACAVGGGISDGVADLRARCRWRAKRYRITSSFRQTKWRRRNFIRDELPADAVYLTGDQHNNACHGPGRAADCLWHWQLSLLITASIMSGRP